MESALMMVRLAFDLDMDKSKNFLLRSLYSSGSSPRSSPKNMRRTCSSAASSPLSSPMINRRMTAMMKQPSFEAASSIVVMNPLTQLPPELAFHIISFLSCKDVLRLSQTSRAGYEYANDESVWKNLINLELGLSFLGGCELIFDEHMERRHNRNHNDPSAAKAQDPMELECPATPSKTWKERFQYLVSIKAELGPVQFRSMKPSRLPVVTTTSGSGAVQMPSPCGSSDCSGRCAAGQPASLGCKHYKRDCKLLAACCGRFFVCRHCHDEQVHDHRIDRYATQLVLCMVCNAIQPVGHNCASPQCQNRPLGSYFCGVCKFYDNDPDKAIFHCEHCQVCKLGRKSESFHCHSCGRCFSKAVMATHPCLNKQGQQGQQTTTEER